MRILFLANHFNTGGIASYVVTLARGLVRRGHDVLVASSGGDRVADLEEAGGRHYRVPLGVKCEVHPKIFLSLLRLSRLVREEKVDIVHAQTRSTQVCASMLSGVTGTIFVSTGHGFFKPRWNRRIFPAWGRAVVAISPQVARHLVEDLRVPEKDVTIVPNGIDLDRYHPLGNQEKKEGRRRWGIEEEAPLVGIVARLSDVKGHRYLLEAMPAVRQAVSHVQCLIVGVGPEGERLKAQASSAGMDRYVRFLHVVNKTEEILPLLDVFVLPSLHEGLGLSAMEAGACGVPVVASHVGGIPEVVRDRETGSLIPPKDPAALADAIIRLLRDPSRMDSLGMRARSVALERFSAEKMVDETIRFYGRVLT